jgi:peroxiredoxin
MIVDNHIGPSRPRGPGIEMPGNPAGVVVGIDRAELIEVTQADRPTDDVPDAEHGRIGYGKYARYTPLGLALLLVLALLAAGIVRTGDDDGTATGPKTSNLIGQPAPEVTVPVLDGGEIRLAELRGEVVVLNFWATWCAPCEAEMPAFQRVYAAGAVDGVPVRIIGVGSKVRDTDQQALAFARTLGVTYPIARDSGGDTPYRGVIGQAFGQQDFWPLTIVIRPDGVVSAVHYGPLDDADLRELIGEAIRA